MDRLEIAGVAIAWVVLTWLVLTEFSYLGTRANAWLYSRAASGYARKQTARRYWPGSAYDRLVRGTLRRCVIANPQVLIVDLACGPGQLALQVAGAEHFRGRVLAVDASAGMIARLRQASEALSEEQAKQLRIVHGTAAEAMEELKPGTIGLVVMMEAGEFMAGFGRTVRRIAEALGPGGELVMTRPAWPVSVLFPFRSQSRRQLKRLLEREGFKAIGIHPWCWRYDVVVARRSGRSENWLGEQRARDLNRRP